MSDPQASGSTALEPPADRHDAGAPAAHRSSGEAGRLLRLLVGASLCVALVFGVVRPLVGDVYRIVSTSMVPTLQAGDRVVANKLAYRFGDPARGDLVVFEEPGGDAAAVKRVVGLPGDRVAMRDGVLVVNGARQQEAYVDYESVDSQFFGPVTVPPGTVFVLGDNRADSRDSRRYGPVPEGDLEGEVVLDF
jgi:signal peptidase I